MAPISAATVVGARPETDGSAWAGGGRRPLHTWMKRPPLVLSEDFSSAGVSPKYRF
jgi:hypothetical protein